MKVLIHVGANGTRETYEYRQGKMLNVEWGAMERVTGMVGIQLEDALSNKGVNALTALIWVLRKRQDPGLRFEEVVFNIEDLSLEVVNDDGTSLTDEGQGADAEPATPKESPGDHGPVKAAGKKRSSSKSAN